MFDHWLKENQRGKRQIRRRRLVPRVMWTIAVTMVGIILPLTGYWLYQTVSATKGKVLGEATTAMAEIEAARAQLLSFDLPQAQQHFLKSYESFSRIETELDQANGLVSLLLTVVPQGQTYYHLLKTGEEISYAGFLMSDIDKLLSPDSWQQSSVTDLLGQLDRLVRQVEPRLASAAKHLQAVNLEHLDPAQRQTVTDLRQTLAVGLPQISKLRGLLDNLLVLLGADKWQRYLVLFQNNLELRPTGGFIGNVALMDIGDGQIQSMEIPAGGAYDYNYGLHEDVLAPKPFRIIKNRWELQDCNWFPDAPTSAKNCARFLEESAGTSVNGVITINLPFFMSLLPVVGNIDMPEYGVVITPENFIPFTQSLVESRAARASGAPKQFLVDLADEILGRVEAALRDPDVVINLLTIMAQSLKSHDIIIYSTDPTVQKWLADNDWSGALHSSASDYLNVNAANLKGGKSDYNIKQTIDYQVETGPAGRLIATVTVRRAHLGQRLPPEAFATQAEKDFNYLTAQPNLAYIRVYAPADAKLLRVRGNYLPALQMAASYDIDQYVEDELLTSVEQDPYIDLKLGSTRITSEFGKSVFGNYLLVNPGETGELVIEYELPLSNETSDYKLVIDKQPGIESKLVVKYLGQRLFDNWLTQDIIVLPTA